MTRASSILFWFSLTIAASLMLYHTSDRVHELNQQLRDMNAQIQDEQKSLHVLRAEWVYLANPTRVENATRKYLAGLRPTSPQQVADINTMTEMLPTRSEAMASVSVTTTPIASIRTSLATRLASAVLAKHKQTARTTTTTTVAEETHHVNERMVMQRTASAQPLPDSIGALLNDLGTHP